MEWQPIDTAPKDGTKVLAVGRYRATEDCEPSEVTYQVVRWWREPTYSLWAACLPTPMRSGRFNPTHWMPLLEPPQ